MDVLKKGDEGSQVQLLQYILKQLYYYTNDINGIFDDSTEEAVIKFQKDNGLVEDGIVGEQTYKFLEPYILGYVEYEIKPGDTIFKITEDYDTSIERVYVANPNLDPFNLQPGEKIIVPYEFDVIKTGISYTYDIMKNDIKGLKARYPFLKVETIGKSVDGKDIYLIRLGEGENKVFYNASHHANEWITTPVLMEWIEEFLKNFAVDGNMKGYNIPYIWNTSTIDIVPMVNPDGVDLVIDGADEETGNYEQLIEWNDGNTDFSKWKANIAGVDLNRNYNAGWEEHKMMEKDLGITGPKRGLYGGPFPESEPETKAMVEQTKKEDYRLVLAYHTQGEVIFWEFMNLQPPEALPIAEKFSEVSGYDIAEPQLYQAFAGYKDFFIQDFRKPGYTIEVGKGVNPLPIDQFDKIYEDNEELLLLAAVI